jgi:hypothetical protein
MMKRKFPDVVRFCRMARAIAPRDHREYGKPSQTDSTISRKLIQSRQEPEEFQFYVYEIGSQRAPDALIACGVGTVQKDQSELSDLTNLKSNRSDFAGTPASVGNQQTGIPATSNISVRETAPSGTPSHQ